MSWPSFRVGSGVAEEVEEEGLGEGVELGEGGAALGPQRLRPVQHLRNPPLLRQRRQGNFEISQSSSGLLDIVAQLRVTNDLAHRQYRAQIDALKEVSRTSDARLRTIANRH